MNYLIIATSQFLFGMFRTLNTRYTAKDKIWLAISTSTMVKVTWLFSTAYGLKGIYDQDWIAGIVYVLFGVVGDRIAFLFKNK